jgi:hypothetical protein
LFSNLSVDFSQDSEEELSEVTYRFVVICEDQLIFDFDFVISEKDVAVSIILEDKLAVRNRQPSNIIMRLENNKCAIIAKVHLLCSFWFPDD